MEILDKEIEDTPQYRSPGDKQLTIPVGSPAHWRDCMPAPSDGPDDDF
jgi:hypothetical protein